MCLFNYFLNVFKELVYCKLFCKSQFFKPEKFSTKQVVDLYDRAKIQTFPSNWSTSGAIDIHH